MHQLAHAFLGREEVDKTIDATLLFSSGEFGTLAIIWTFHKIPSEGLYMHHVDDSQCEMPASACQTAFLVRTVLGVPIGRYGAACQNFGL